MVIDPTPGDVSASISETWLSGKVSNFGFNLSKEEPILFCPIDAAHAPGGTLTTGEGCEADCRDPDLERSNFGWATSHLCPELVLGIQFIPPLCWCCPESLDGLPGTKVTCASCSCPIHTPLTCDCPHDIFKLWHSHLLLGVATLSQELRDTFSSPFNFPAWLNFSTFVWASQVSNTNIYFSFFKMLFGHPEQRLMNRPEPGNTNGHKTLHGHDIHYRIINRVLKQN